METTTTITLTNWCPFSNASVGSEHCWSRCGFSRGDKVDSRTPLTMLWWDLPFTHNLHIKVYSYWNFQPVRVHRSSLKTWKKLIWIWISFPKNYFCQNVISFKFRAIQVTGSVWKPADLFHFYLCQFSPLTSDHISTSITEWQVAYISPPPTPSDEHANSYSHVVKGDGGGGRVWW